MRFLLFYFIYFILFYEIHKSTQSVWSFLFYFIYVINAMISYILFYSDWYVLGNNKFYFSYKTIKAKLNVAKKIW